MTNYSPAEPDDVAHLDKAMAAYRSDLVEAEVRVSLVMAYAKITDEGEEAGPALKVGGYPALARVRIVPHRDRVQGLADAEIAVDGNRWMFMGDEEKAALLDHELAHLELVRDGENKIKADDGGRPRLKMRLHDYRVEGFFEVMERHKDVSFEARAVKALFDGLSGQGLFAFMAEPSEVDA